jgi:DNA-binding MarR family transcriptional regulator
MSPETRPITVQAADFRAAELRPSQALHLWRDVHLDLVRDDQPDLSSRQTAILLIIYLDLPPHTVRGLAKRLCVSKPVITRALDSMGKLGLVDRRRDEADRRNVIILRTVKGALAVEGLGDLILARLKDERT